MKHFTLDEMIYSETAIRLGIDNRPGPQEEKNLSILMDLNEKVRSLLGDNIMRVSSGYRCLELNEARGGSLSSQHMKGQANDFRCPAFGTSKEVAQKIADSRIPFDQLIYEGSWVHISWDYAPRGMVLTASFGQGGASYMEGVV